VIASLSIKFVSAQLSYFIASKQKGKALCRIKPVRPSRCGLWKLDAGGSAVGCRLPGTGVLKISFAPMASALRWCAAGARFWPRGKMAAVGVTVALAAAGQASSCSADSTPAERVAEGGVAHGGASASRGPCGFVPVAEAFVRGVQWLV